MATLDGVVAGVDVVAGAADWQLVAALDVGGVGASGLQRLVALDVVHEADVGGVVVAADDRDGFGLSGVGGDGDKMMAHDRSHTDDFGSC